MEQLYQEIIRGHFLSDIPLSGINAPVFIWLASFFLLAFTIVWVIFFRQQRSRVLQQMRKISKLLDDLPAVVSQNHLNGFNLTELDEFRKIFEKDAYFKKLWGLFEASFVKVEKGDEERFFAGKPPETVFSFQNVVEKRINMNLWNAVPSLLTSSGLFCTFTAILIALMGVTVNPATQQVTGIQVLISGLSGKFVSSVTALHLK